MPRDTDRLDKPTRDPVYLKPPPPHRFSVEAGQTATVTASWTSAQQYRTAECGFEVYLVRSDDAGLSIPPGGQLLFSRNNYFQDGPYVTPMPVPVKVIGVTIPNPSSFKRTYEIRVYAKSEPPNPALQWRRCNYTGDPESKDVAGEQRWTATYRNDVFGFTVGEVWAAGSGVSGVTE